jgi:hypothetical protein
VFLDSFSHRKDLTIENGEVMLHSLHHSIPGTPDSMMGTGIAEEDLHGAESMHVMWAAALHYYGIPDPFSVRVRHVSAIKLGTAGPTNCPGAGECVRLSESVAHVR